MECAWGDGLKNKKIYILACKDLSYNTRVDRQAEVLLSAGYGVKVYCLAPPKFTATPDIYRPVKTAWLERLKTFRLKLFSRLFKAGTKDKPAISDGPTLPPRLGRYTCPFSYLLEGFAYKAALRGTLESVASSDILLVHDFFALRAGIDLQQKTGAKMVFDAVELPYLLTEPAQVSAYQGLIGHLIKKESSGLRGAAAVLTVSLGIADIMAQSYGIKQPRVLRNCSRYVDPPAHSGLKDDLGLDNSIKLVLYLNSIVPGRGLEQLARCLPMLPEEIHIAALGPKPYPLYHEALLGKIHELGMENRFHFPQTVPPDQVTRYASGADIGVIPSQDYWLNIRHCMPNRLFEMVMARLPIAVSALPDMKAFVEQYQLGVYFNQTDSGDMAKAIMHLLEPAAFSRYKQNVLSSAETLCWEVESQKFLDLMAGI